MLTSEEVYNAFCRDRCKYLNPPTVDALDACTDCPVSRLSAPPPWYAYPDYIPPPDTPCLLVSIEKSKMHYMIGVYKVFSETKKRLFQPDLFGQARADLSGCLAAYKRTGIFYAKT